MAHEHIRLRIAELRKKKGYTQDEFAQKLSKSVDTISNYERGKTGLDAIQLVIKMCDLLDCKPSDLVESFPVSNQPQNFGDIHNILRDWWSRVFAEKRTLGGKSIDGIIAALKNWVESISNEDIAAIFCPNEDLEKRLRLLIVDFETNQSSPYDMEPSGERIHDDPNICAFIFCYLKTKEKRFLNNFIPLRLRQFVKTSSLQSGSPSYFAQELALSDLTN